MPGRISRPRRLGLERPPPTSAAKICAAVPGPPSAPASAPFPQLRGRAARGGGRTHRAAGFYRKGL